MEEYISLAWLCMFDTRMGFADGSEVPAGGATAAHVACNIRIAKDSEGRARSVSLLMNEANSETISQLQRVLVLWRACDTAIFWRRYREKLPIL